MPNNILVTGGAGFIGSHLVDALIKERPDDKIIIIDNLTYAGDISRLDNAAKSPNYQFILEDIRNHKEISELIAKYEINQVYHLAAETHVDRSIESPDIFFASNLMGTFNLLDGCRNLWMNNSLLRSEYKEARFLHVSTDEIYGSLGADGYFTETTRYCPSSPYSASKAAADLAVQSFHTTYNLPALISNCSNNYGARQHYEKLIPTIIKAALNGDSINIYGDGKNIRDWLSVSEHCYALMHLMQHGETGENYNIGTNNEWSNIDLANMICDFLQDIAPTDGKQYHNQISFIDDRPGHDFRYALDNKKLKDTGWKQRFNFGDELTKTLDWYVKKFA